MEIWFRKFLVLFGFGLAGIAMAIIQGIMFTQGMVLPELMTHFGLTSLAAVQAVTIVAFLLIGAVLSAIL